MCVLWCTNVICVTTMSSDITMSECSESESSDTGVQKKNVKKRTFLAVSYTHLDVYKRQGCDDLKKKTKNRKD